MLCRLPYPQKFTLFGELTRPATRWRNWAIAPRNIL